MKDVGDEHGGETRGRNRQSLQFSARGGWPRRPRARNPREFGHVVSKSWTVSWTTVTPSRLARDRSDDGGSGVFSVIENGRIRELPCSAGKPARRHVTMQIFSVPGPCSGRSVRSPAGPDGLCSRFRLRCGVKVESKLRQIGDNVRFIGAFAASSEKRSERVCSPERRIALCGADPAPERGGTFSPRCGFAYKAPESYSLDVPFAVSSRRWKLPTSDLSEISRCAILASLTR